MYIYISILYILSIHILYILYYLSILYLSILSLFLLSLLLYILTRSKIPAWSRNLAVCIKVMVKRKRTRCALLG